MLSHNLSENGVNMNYWIVYRSKHNEHFSNYNAHGIAGLLLLLSVFWDKIKDLGSIRSVQTLNRQPQGETLYTPSPKSR